ncbi:hypothetical protein Mapa_005191 [Marchantia paleacea]|nr:hypothetical protein Mapa_005191 [Marchantia paleacea]
MDRKRVLQLLECLTAVLLLGFSCVIAPAFSTVDLASSCSLSQPECSKLSSVPLDGYLTFFETKQAAQDFGRLRSLTPAAVLHPGSTRDIMSIVRAVFLSSSNISIAARGPGHSVNGQSQVEKGVVVEMSSFRGINVNVTGMYVEATAGELWIDVLQACMKEGLSPRSFTDYLHLSVGGTLSNAGVSGQSFRWGPQISNVLQLEVVTGMGELITCSREVRPDLFFAVLGGLGQFGIITKARIYLQPVPTNVHWVRAIYSDFASFQRDQLRFISEAKKSNVFDYVEGFVVANSPSYEFGYNSVPFDGQTVNATLMPDRETTSLLYYIELAKNYNNNKQPASSLREKVEEILAEAKLECVPTQVFVQHTSYLEFLERVHATELMLRSLGLWEVPHPWINLLVPASKMVDFERTVFRNLDASTINGPVIVYPFNRNMWDSRMSAVTPDEDVFYLVAFLQSVVPSMGPNLKTLLDRNSGVWKYCEMLGCKQYLPKYSTLSDWQTHFGAKWKDFVFNKLKFDPKAILSPSQGIFARGEDIPVPLSYR